MQYDFSLPAGGSQVIDVKGKFFKYKSGIGQIRVILSKGGYIDLLPGQGVWNVEFSSLIIKDKTGAINSGILISGDFDFHDDRISGSVEVIDGGKNRTLAQQVFWAYGYQAGVAGQSSVVQLWNPSGSGKKLVVAQVAAAVNQAGSGILHVSYQSVALANVYGVPKNKLIGGAASIAQIRNASLVGMDGSAQYMCDLYCAGQTHTPIKFTEPVIVLPGYGLQIDSAINSGISVSGQFEFFEESI